MYAGLLGTWNTTILLDAFNLLYYCLDYFLVLFYKIWRWKDSRLVALCQCPCN